jgi:hypothetical protein
MTNSNKAESSSRIRTSRTYFLVEVIKSPEGETFKPLPSPPGFNARPTYENLKRALNKAIEEGDTTYNNKTIRVLFQAWPEVAIVPRQVFQVS